MTSSNAPCPVCGGDDRFYRVAKPKLGGDPFWNCNGCDHKEYDRGGAPSGTKYRGSSITLAQAESPTKPGKAAPTVYADLADYATQHGADLAVYQNAGWSDDTLYAYEYKARDGKIGISYERTSSNRSIYPRQAVRFETDAGPRWRFLDGDKPKYWHSFGTHEGANKEWYKLSEAIALALDTSQPLVLCNGEASTVAAQACGVPAVAVAGGGEKLIPDHLLEALTNLWTGSIIVALDGDAAGRKAAPGLTAQLIAAGYTAHAVDLGNGHDLADFARLHQADIMAKLPNCPPLDATGITGTAPSTATPTARTIPPTGPTINVTDENLGRATDEIWSVILASPYGPNLYRYGSEIAYKGDTLAVVDADTWRGMVNRAASFVVDKTGRGGATVTSEVLPPLAMIRDSLIFPPCAVPVIDRVSPLPIFSQAGQLLMNGYHADSRILVESDITPESLTVAEAKSLILDDLLVDFPFAEQSDRANAIAYLLAPLVREMCGPTPLHLIDAAQRGTGKTLFLDLVHDIWTGHPAPVSDLPLNAEEQRKRLTSTLLTAPVSVVFDDIGYLGGHAIQRAVTGSSWVDRLLGGNKTTTLPIRCIWAASGNNVTLGGDMVRRVILIRLESAEENPSQRTGFKRPEAEQRAWVHTNRAKLINACTTLVTHGLTTGTTGTPSTVTMGGFAQYVTTMSRVLSGIGVPGFCENIARVYAREDSRQSGWKALVQEWWDTFGERTIAAGALVKLIEDSLTCEITLDGDSDRAKATTAGKLLRSKIGTVYAYPTIRLRIEQTTNTKGHVVYRLREMADTHAPSGGIPRQDAIAGHSQHSQHRDPPKISKVFQTSETPSHDTGKTSEAAMLAMLAMSGDGIATPQTADPVAPYRVENQGTDERPDWCVIVGDATVISRGCARYEDAASAAPGQYKFYAARAARTAAQQN